MLRGDPSLGNTFKKADLVAAATAADKWADTNAPSRDAQLPKLWRDTATAIQKDRLWAYVWMKRGGVM